MWPNKPLIIICGAVQGYPTSYHESNYSANNNPFAGCI